MENAESCHVCHALVSEGYMEYHIDWHAEILYRD